MVSGWDSGGASAHRGRWRSPPRSSCCRSRSARGGFHATVSVRWSGSGGDSLTNGRSDGMSIVTFDTSRVDALRSAAQSARLVEEAADGWSLSPVSPLNLLSVFDALKLRPGL